MREREENADHIEWEIGLCRPGLAPAGTTAPRYTDSATWAACVSWRSWAAHSFPYFFLHFTSLSPSPSPPWCGCSQVKYHRAAHTGTVCVSMHKHRDHHRQGPDWHDTGTGYIHTTYSAHSTSSLYIYSFVSQYHPQVTCCWTATLSLFLFLVNYNFENYGEFKLDYKYHILTFWVT